MRIYEMSRAEVIHTVAHGETLAGIADFYGTTVQDILSHNSGCESLMAGDMLVITRTNARIYTVQPLDTVERIARRLGVTAEDIRARNNITADLYLGQRLIIE